MFLESNVKLSLDPKTRCIYQMLALQMSLIHVKHVRRPKIFLSQAGIKPETSRSVTSEVNDISHATAGLSLSSGHAPYLNSDCRVSHSPD